MINISLIFTLMADVEKIYKNELNKDKKHEVLSSIKGIIGEDEYIENLEIIDDVIEFIILLSVNREMLKEINRKASTIFCCK